MRRVVWWLAYLVAMGVFPWPAFLVYSADEANQPLVPVPVPDPLRGDNPRLRLLPQAAPEPGRAFRDSAFGTRLMRVTSEPGLRHEYARFDPFNCDQSFIVLISPREGEFRVYRTQRIPYDAPGNLVCTLDVAEPRWDPRQPQIIWGLTGLRIVTVDVMTNEVNVVKDFAQDGTIGPLVRAEPDLYRITTKDEGESSDDKRFWALAIQGSADDDRLRYVFCWDRQEDRVLGVHRISLADRNVDWVGMSPLGKWVIIGSEFDNSGQLIGPQLADRSLTRFHRFDYAGGHADVGLDTRGREVLIMQNSRTDHIDLLPLSEKTQPILNAGGSYEHTNRTPLVRLHYADDSPVGFHSGVHVSCNAPGWAVISTYTEPRVQVRNWLDRTILLVRLDPDQPVAYYLAQVHNTTGSYWEETQATITTDGSKVVWASNHGERVGQERCFLMQLDVPGTKWLEGTGEWDLDQELPGAGPDASDVWWQQVSPHERQLVPRHGAALAIISGREFEQLDARDLSRCRFSTDSISGSDRQNALAVGTILALRTSEGRLAKLQVAGYRPGSLGANYDIRWKWVLYRGP